MWCAECGKPMQLMGYAIDFDAWKACCNRLGYWYPLPPLPQDRWLGMPQSCEFITQDGELKRAYFYPTAKWPVGKVPVAPLDNP